VSPSGRPPGFRGVFRDDAAARGVYAEAAGIQRRIPRAVAVPGDVDDVVALVKWAASTGTTLVPRGAGSSMAGGAIGEGVIVDLTRLSSLDVVDVEARRVRAGPGVVLGALNEHLLSHGLRFPVDPSSWAFCTLGGIVSTNAGGARSVRVGMTRRWVTALDCVFADGSRAEVRRGSPPPNVRPVRRFLDAYADTLRAGEAADPAEHRGVRKESSGYATALWARDGELIDLLVGSEGTLALFVGIELALEARPMVTASLLAAFPTLEAAVTAASIAREAGAAACELLDRTFLDVVAAGPLPVAIDADTEAVLLTEIEGDDPAATRQAARAIASAFEGAGASAVREADTPAAQKSLWALRHAASPILARLDPALKSMQFIEDGAVPPGRLPEYVRGVRAALARQGIRGVIFGHAGDAHVHVNPLVDVRLPDWRARVERLLDEVTALVARLGGTVAGEHGDGRLRAPLLERVWGEVHLARFAAVKDAFDPAAILNRGAKLPGPGARRDGLGDVKYDPELAPLPSEARRALDHVERERAYADFRLALLDG
jgi:FAD/FMN-containing dehydrogenase